MITKQDYYDLLVKSASDGTFPSSDVDGTCKYRANSRSDCKQKCAIGVLIPDEMYFSDIDSGLEPSDIKSVISKYPHINDILAVEDLSLENFLGIQYIHDDISHSSWNPELFVGRINKLKCFEHVNKINLDA